MQAIRPARLKYLNNLAAGALRPGLTRGARMRKVAQRPNLVRSNLAKARHDPPEPPTGLLARPGL